MAKLFIVALLLPLASAASAQTDNNSACARDVSRFCRAKMNEGEMLVLASLQENRAKHGKACLKVLTDNGR